MVMSSISVVFRWSGGAEDSRMWWCYHYLLCLAGYGDVINICCV